MLASFIASAKAFFSKAKSVLGFTSPRGQLFKKIAANPWKLKSLEGALGTSKAETLKDIVSGNISGKLEVMVNDKDRRKSLQGKKLVEEINKYINDEYERTGKPGRPKKVITRAIFASTWTFEGVYFHKYERAVLRHKNTWYNYELFPWPWFRAMMKAKTPGGLGAGSVWWATYKRNQKTRKRLRVSNVNYY